MKVSKKILMELQSGNLVEVDDLKQVSATTMFCGISLDGVQLYMFCKDPNKESSVESANPSFFDDFMTHFYGDVVATEFDEHFKELTGKYIEDYVKDLQI